MAVTVCPILHPLHPDFVLELYLEVVIIRLLCSFDFTNIFGYCIIILDGLTGKIGASPGCAKENMSCMSRVSGASWMAIMYQSCHVGVITPLNPPRNS